jgi:hypothetical protein bfra3_15159
MGTVDNLRQERKGRTIPLARFYADFKVGSSNICYGFVEGEDDPSYYRTVIKNKLPKGCSIILYPSNGKENVKYIFEEISQRNFPINRITYFIDRDLSSIIEDPNLICGAQIYVTDNYSIENDILSEDTFVSIAQDLLGFSTLTLEELERLKQCYILAKEKFENIMVPIMANIIHWKKCNCKPANYKNLKIKDIICVKNGIVNFKSNMEDAIKILYQQSQVDFNYYQKDKIEIIMNDITDRKLSSKILRGKYLATFFVKFCNSLYDDYENIGFARNKGRKISDSDIMDSVAPRSIPPESLIDFVSNVILPYYKQIKW